MMDRGSPGIWVLMIGLCCPWICQCIEHFDVDCVNTTHAYLYTDLTKYTVTVPKGCSATVVNGSVYSLTESCLGDDKIIVVSPRVVSSFHLSGGKFTKVFTVKCINTVDTDGSNMKTTTNIGVIGVPDHKHLLITTPEVSMYLTKADPTTTRTLPQALGEKDSVLLGEKLYIVIASLRQNKTGVFYLPEQCEASSDSPLNLTIPLWDRLVLDSDCVKEPTLMDKFSVFPSGYKFGGATYNLAFAPIYTFIFDQLYVHSNNVTYTCSFIVCPSTTASGSDGRCAQRLKNDARCFSPLQSQRRRRQTPRLWNSVKNKTLSITVQVQNVRSFLTSESPPAVTVVIIVTVLVSFVIIVVIIIMCLLYSEARRRKRKQQKVKQHFEMSMKRRL